MADGLTAAILAVGSELLTPHKTDTNSLYVSEVLNDLGIAVRSSDRRDNRAELASHVEHALSRNRVLILTGGLGPTDDDLLTRDVVAANLGLVMTRIRDRRRDGAALRGARLKMPAVNRRQAWCRGARSSSTIRMAPRPASGSRTAIARSRCCRVHQGNEARWTARCDAVRRDRGGVRLHRRLVRVAGKGESPSRRSCSDLLAVAESIADDRDDDSGGTRTGRAAPVKQSADAVAAAGALNIAVSALARRSVPICETNGAGLEEVVGDLLRARGGGWRSRSRARRTRDPRDDGHPGS